MDENEFEGIDANKLRSIIYELNHVKKTTMSKEA